MPHINQILLDMDGVLADFVGGICKLHNRTCYDKPEHMGEFKMEKLWGMSKEEFWIPQDKQGFWLGLEKTVEADDIVQLADETVGFKNIAIVTSPSNNIFCISEKKVWMKKYFPGLEKRMIFTNVKGFVAGPNRLLIDDKDKNVDEFNRAGGWGILLPRYWNRRWERAEEGLDVVIRNIHDLETIACLNL